MEAWIRSVDQLVDILARWVAPDPHESAKRPSYQARQPVLAPAMAVKSGACPSSTVPPGELGR